jgi:hypothetical protein
VPESIDWITVEGSSRIVAESYLIEQETILVRFPNGVEWAYQACPPQEWEAFTAPTRSRGAHISEILNYKPNCRWAG